MEVGHYHSAPIHLHAGCVITAFILAWPFWPMVGLRGNGLALRSWPSSSRRSWRMRRGAT